MALNASNNYDVEDGLSIDRRNNDVSEDEDIDIYGTRVINGPKKNKLKEILKRNACAMIGVGCFAIFTVSSVYLLISSMEQKHDVQTNQVLDLIDLMKPPQPPDLSLPYDTMITPTMIIPTIPSIGVDFPAIPRSPRRRRY